MVNTGKPSPGCHACRARRMKCDETKPQCRKCRNRGIECPGYRDLTALRIVDQTQKYSSRFAANDQGGAGGSKGGGAAAAAGAVVASRHTSQGSASSRRSLASSSASSSSSSSAAGPSSDNAEPSARSRQLRQQQQQPPLPPGLVTGGTLRPCPGTPVGEQVFNFFFSYFVLNSQSGQEQGYLDFLLPLLPNQPKGSPLPLAFSAAALAAFGTQRRVKDMLVKAEDMYGKALEATQRAIGDPGRARDNSTLASVALLCVFEQIRPTRPSLQKPEAWGSHLDGAWALVKARGKAQFRSPVGRRIFVITRSLLTSRAMAYSIPFDPQLYQLTDELDQDPVQKRYGELSLKIADLRVATERTIGAAATRLPTPDNITALLRRADALEAEYAIWASTLPPAWRPIKSRWPGPPSSPAGSTSSSSSSGSGSQGSGSGGRPAPRVDTYTDLFVCYVLNMARSARIYCRSIALRCVDLLRGPQPPDYRSTAEHALARGLCSALIAEVVASVPYAFGKVRRGEDGGAEAVPGGGADGAGMALPRCTAGMFMLWPVFTAASSDFATEEQRGFLRAALNHIAGELGIGMATVLAGYDFRQPSMPIMLARFKRQSLISALMQRSN